MSLTWVVKSSCLDDVREASFSLSAIKAFGGTARQTPVLRDTICVALCRGFDAGY